MQFSFSLKLSVSNAPIQQTSQFYYCLHCNGFHRGVCLYIIHTLVYILYFLPRNMAKIVFFLITVDVI